MAGPVIRMEMVDAVMGEMVRYFQGDVRRINHALKVYALACLIAAESELTGQEREIIQVAALLHDIGIHEAEKRYQSAAGKYQEIEGPPIAREMVMRYHPDPAFIDRVCYLIGHHHTYSAIDGTDFQILVEADFLVNICEDAMNPASVRNIREKFFRTGPGIRLLDSMYGATEE